MYHGTCTMILHHLIPSSLSIIGGLDEGWGSTLSCRYFKDFHIYAAKIEWNSLPADAFTECYALTVFKVGVHRHYSCMLLHHFPPGDVVVKCALITLMKKKPIKLTAFTAFFVTTLPISCLFRVPDWKGGTVCNHRHKGLKILCFTTGTAFAILRKFFVSFLCSVYWKKSVFQSSFLIESIATWLNSLNNHCACCWKHLAW